VLFAVAMIVVVFVLRFLLPAWTPRTRPSGGRDPSNAIAVLEKVRIGGSDQWVLQRSEDTSNPVILFLHGGPGTSQLTMNRRNSKDLEKSFIVVNWDQRGAGKSYCAAADTSGMHIDRFVEDTKELTLFLLKKFRKERIVLVGHSWGSVIGALAASRYPELFHCYVGIGQMSNMAESERASYDWTLNQAREKKDTSAVTKLDTMGRPPYQGDWQSSVLTQRMLLGRFGGEIHGSRSGAFWMVLRNLLFSSEYTLVDRINVFRGIMGSMRLLWPELSRVNLFEAVPELTIPVFFIEGRFDHEVPSEIAEKYFKALRAPSKELIWFENSAHLPNAEERDAFNRVLLDHIRPSIMN
jgi:pimeloyl-ACP methyl ester carboxylesterase